MTTATLVTQDLQPRPEPAPPRPVLPLAGGAAVVAAVGAITVTLAAYRLIAYTDGSAIAIIIGLLLVLGALYPILPTVKAIAAGRQRSRLLNDAKLVTARRVAAGGREEALIAMGCAAAAIIIGALLLATLANRDGGIAYQYFRFEALRQAFPETVAAFWTNIWVAIVSFLIVLILGLLLAIMRLLPGRAGAPLRLIAVFYTDTFRAVPAVVVILLIVFGTPLAIPSLADTKPVYLGIVALSLTYAAYVAEVYRSGVASIHPSQSAAARSLGLSYGQTLRKILIPQAVRRVIPPLLNDFISLQKDTSLLLIAGILEGTGTAQLWQAKLFNLSPITLVALFFLIITVPQARFVDWLIDRDANRRAGG